MLFLSKKETMHKNLVRKLEERFALIVLQGSYMKHIDANKPDRLSSTTFDLRKN